MLNIYWFSILGRLIVPFLNIRKKKNNTILFLAAFYPKNAGYNWRVHKWIEQLNTQGYNSVSKYTLKASGFDILLTNRSLFLIKTLKKRFWQVISSSSYETVIVRRELLLYNDYGNLFLDKLLLKIHPNAILDFDDDISEAKNQPKEINSWYGKLLLEDGNKFNNSLRLYSNFIVASIHLKSRIIEQNVNYNNIAIIPTCVDYNDFPQKIYKSNKPFTFGWIGGNHNYFLLDLLLPTFEKIASEYKFKLLVIGGIEYKRNVNFDIEFRKWSLHSEIKDLLDIDVGLMPLINDMESKGKGGFKLIQYMGLGIVSIASPITINTEIVDHEKNSFLADKDDDWEFWITELLNGKIDMQKIGNAARLKINNNYTFNSNKENYLKFIENVRNSRVL
jgi:glycosyltransferase involved in cell wall biosynthesis